MSDTRKKNLVSILSVAGAVLIFFVMLLMPRPQGMSVQAQKSLALFTFALIMWIARPIPIYQTSIVVILLLPLIGILKKQDQAFETLGYSIIWL
ncbi:MAG: anion permease, partial [Fusobacteriaceae bacterium]|nr:anion permease [Fusobacteriaceae bacterium]